MKTVINGGAVGSPLLGVLGTRAQSNFHPMGGNTNRGGALAGGSANGGVVSNRGGATNASPLQPICDGGHEV